MGRSPPRLNCTSSTSSASSVGIHLPRRWRRRWGKRSTDWKEKWQRSAGCVLRCLEADNSGIPSFDKPGLLKQSVDCLIIIIADVESAFTTDLEAAGNGARRVLRQIDDHRKTRHRVDACSVECTAGIFDNAVANWYVWVCGYGVEALPSVSGRLGQGGTALRPDTAMVANTA